MAEDNQNNEIKEILEWLLSVEPVSSLTGNEFVKSKIDLVTQVSEYFRSIGGKVEREGIGVIVLDGRGVKDSIAHGLSREKAIAFKAVPNILKYGKIIDYQQNWKGRGYDTYVIDAPIKIGKDDYIAEVIINQQTSKGINAYYLHEVEIKQKTQSAFKTGMFTGAPQASKLIIIKKLLTVN